MCSFVFSYLFLLLIAHHGALLFLRQVDFDFQCLKQLDALHSQFFIFIFYFWLWDKCGTSHSSVVLRNLWEKGLSLIHEA